MATAIALRQEDAFEATRTAAPTRNEVLARYRHLRAISRRHHSEAMALLSKTAILHHARRLGVAHGTLILADMEELTLAVDLAIHTAPAGRSRAIDRYARSVQPAPGSDEALVLEAMRHARFVVAHVESRHETAGVIAKDLIRETKFWLVDEGLESTIPDGSVMAMRLYAPDRFSMTAGVAIPVDRELFEDVADAIPQLRHKAPEELANDRRFAEGIYRAAIAHGIMEQVAYLDPVNDTE